MRFFFALLILTNISLAETKLLLVGGGKRPVQAMKEFAHLAGGEKADILIIPWASQSTESGFSIKAEFSVHTSGIIDVLPLRLNPKELEQLVTRLQKCTGIFFTGGDQNTLMTLLREYKLVHLLRKRFQAGVVFGGTSAGTAIMSNPMLTGSADLSVLDGSQVELAEGLGLLPSSIIVDQHFIVRSRFNRLAGLILNNKAQLGLAVDENTSLLIIDHLAKVIGPTQVLLFKRLSDHKLDLSVMNPGKTFSLLKP
jgi:cyanophycinase